MQKARKRLLITGCALIAIAVMLILYAVLIGTGVINSRQETLVIRAGTAEKAYDGQVLVCEEWTLVHGELKSGHTVIPSFSGSQVAPGQSLNQVTVRIIDGNNVDVTDEYRIEYLSGTLSVYSTQLNIRSSDLSKVYDGTPLTATNQDWMLESGALKMGHRIVATLSATLTEVGTCENPVSAVVLDEAGADVTDLYELRFTAGTLRVEPRPIVLMSESVTKTYDGHSYIHDHAELVGGALVEGHSLHYEFPEHAPDVGVKENSFSVSVLDETGADVTGLYAAETRFGTLTIEAREITIESASVKKKEGDGPLTAHSYQITSGQLAENHTIDAVFEGIQEGIGSSLNIFTVDIKDPSGSSVLSNYVVTLTPGYLTVVEFLVDDGTTDVLPPRPNSSISGSNPIDDYTPVLNFQTSVSGYVYLRLQSYGKYENYSWSLSPAVPDMAAEFNPLYWVGSALARTGETPVHLDASWLIEPEGCLVPYYVQSQFDISADDSFVPFGNRTYSLDFFHYDLLGTLSNKVSEIAPDPTYAEAELVYRAYVYENFLDIPDDALREAITRHLKEARISPLSETLIQDVATYIQNVAAYDLNCKQAPDGVDPIVFFLSSSEPSGVCRHFASAAVMMYRALGIPARYVEGYLGNSVANELSTVTAMQKHAWVEVYLDGLGWLPVEVTGGGSGIAEDKTPPIPLVVKIVPVRGIANGTEYKPGSHRVFGDLNPDHVFTCTYEGSRIEVGESNSYIGSYVITDQVTGEDVTHLYEVETYPGIIQVVSKASELEEIEDPIILVIKPADERGPYNGQPLTPQSWAYVEGSEELKAGHSLVCTYNGQQIVPGIGESRIATYRVVNQSTGIDVTDKYDIVCMSGKLEVVAPEIYLTIKPNDIDVPYSGETYAPSQWVYTPESDRLLDGHEIICTLTGSLRDPGFASSAIENLSIVDSATGEDVSYLYNVITQNGRISITALLTIRPQDVIEKYTGETYTPNAWIYDPTGGVLMPGHALYCDFTGSQTLPGSSISTVENIVVVDTATGEIVTDRYEIERLEGSITVETIYLHIQAEDVSETFSGETYAATEWLYRDDSEMLLDHHELTCTINGSLRFPGTDATTIRDIQIWDTNTGEEVTACYNILSEDGTISVMSYPIHIMPVAVEGIFNGDVYAANEWRYGVGSSPISPNHQLTCTINGSLRFPGTVSSTLSDICILDINTGEDLTAGYSVSSSESTVTVHPVQLIIKPVDLSTEFTGEPVGVTTWEYVDGSDSLQYGHELLYTITDGIRTAAGVTTTGIEVMAIRDTVTGEDVTNGYNITTQPGTITVEGIDLILKPTDLWERFTGDAYEVTTYEYVDGSESLLAGHQLSFTVNNGSQIFPCSLQTELVDLRVIDIATGADVTEGYNIMTQSGTITVEAIDLIIKPTDVWGRFTGYAYEVTTYEYVDGNNNLLAGHQLSFTVNNGSQIFPCSLQTDLVDLRVIDTATGADMTAGYNIMTQSGSITVEAIHVTVKPTDVWGRFTGDAYEVNTWMYANENERFLDGHEMTCTIYDNSRTFAGTTYTSLGDFKVVNIATGEDMTAGYNITAEQGTITVEAINMVIKPVDVIGPHTGTPYVATAWEYATETSEQLLSNHTLSCVYTGSQLELGTSYSEMTDIVIMDTVSGVDMTAGYSIEVLPGLLSVEQYTLHVKPVDVYAVPVPENAERFATDWEYLSDSDQLMPNHELSCIYVGSLIGIGSTTTSMENVVITDTETGEDVTNLYFITTSEGYIEVDYRDITIKPMDVISNYTGDLAEPAGHEITWGSLVEGHTLNTTIDGSVSGIGTAITSITAYSIIDSATGADVTAGYNVTLETGVINITPIQLTVSAVDVSGPYTGQPYTNNGWYISSGTPLENHRVEANLVGSQTLPGTSAITFDGVRVVDITTGADVSEYTDVSEFYSIELETGTITVSYVGYLAIKPVDRQEMFSGGEYTPETWEHTVSDDAGLLGHEVNVLREGDRLVDVTYEGAYTFPVWPMGPFANEDEEFAAHCQPTAIASYRILDADGNDVTDLYYVATEPGYIAIKGVTFTITPKSHSIQYDGLLHEASGFTCTNISNQEVFDQYNVVADVIGSRTEFGSSVITMGEVRVYDADGNDVTAAFSITTGTGTLQIYAEKLTIFTGSAEKTYDGTALTNGEWSLTDGQLLTGHSITVEMNAAITEAGSKANTPTVHIFDENGEDVTSWYIITYNSGTLVVNRITLTIRSKDAQKIYAPGEVLICNEYDIIEGWIADGEQVEVLITGSQGSVGYSENTIRWENIHIYRESDGKETTSNYDISAISGILTVTPPANA